MFIAEIIALTEQTGGRRTFRKEHTKGNGLLIALIQRQSEWAKRQNTSRDLFREQRWGRVGLRREKRKDELNISLNLFFYLEDGGSRFLQNLGNILLDYKASGSKC